MDDTVMKGWASHKFCDGSTYLMNKRTLQRVRIYPGQCVGCGARKTIYRNGRSICAYCKGDKNGKL